MTISFICWTPELLLIVSITILICYATGAVASPLNEVVLILRNTNIATQQKILFNKPNIGPNHIISHVFWWVIVWCILGALLLFNCPITAFQTGGMFVRDSFTINLNTALLIYAAVAIIVSGHWFKVAGIIHTEYFILILLSIIGQILLVICTDLISVFLCLELQSFCFVVLCSLNVKNAYSLEAGIKYFLLSAFSTSFLLLGIGLIYWQTGTTNCHQIAELISVITNEPSLVLWFGIWLVGLGLFWKLAAAPLHMWAADVYEGSWSSVTLLISTLPKIAVLGFWVHSWHIVWIAAFGEAILFFSAASLIVGAVSPLGQYRLKRLIAFSSIGHIGFILIPLAGGIEGYSSIWIYLSIYALTSLATWGLLMWPYGRPGASTSNAQFLTDLSGLNQQMPVAATTWVAIIFSLAGLPPIVGFLGKLGLLWWSLNNGQYALVFIALVATLLGSVYYLRVLKVAYLDVPANWGAFSKISGLSAYVIASSWFTLVIFLWYGTPLLLSTHLLALCS
jgi:NADH-quinone oxidoreductase subunit N